VGKKKKEEEEKVMTTCRTSMPPLKSKDCYSGKNQQLDYIITIYRSKTDSLSVFDEQILQSISEMWKAKSTCSGDTQNCFNTPLSHFGIPQTL
jgi:hypothetical protein